MSTPQSPIAADEIDVGTVNEMVGYHLRRAANIMGNDFGRALSGTGIRQALFGILSVLDANPGIPQGLAGRALGIQRANMVSLINELVEAGMVDREVSPDDRRAFSLSLTEVGQQTFRQSVERIRESERKLLTALDPGDYAELIALLSKIEACDIGA